MNQTRVRVRASALLLLLAAVGGCSARDRPPVPSADGRSATGQPDATASPAPGDAHEDPVRIWQRWAACMRAHGVPMSDPPLDANNVPQIDFSHAGGVPESAKRSAQQACRSIIAGGQGKDDQSGGQVAVLAKFAACMRRHGVPNFPDPDPTGTLPPLAGAGIDVQSPAFVAAYQACRAPGNGGGG